MPRPTIFISFKCDGCGKIFKRIRWYANNIEKRNPKHCYCGLKCKKKYHKANWKGGIRKQGRYRMIWIAKGKYVFEHRFVMERHLGRKLKREEMVHHINGNPLDNRIKNLVLCQTHGQHTLKYHPLQRKKGKYLKHV